MLIKVFAFASILVFSLIAQANVKSIECWDGDCFANGWTTKDKQAGTFLDHQCYREGCMRSGWIVGGSAPGNFYTQCKQDSCFKRGWWEVNRQTQMLEATVTCQVQNGISDCLRFGWTRMANGITSVTTCKEQNCREIGWLRTSNVGLESESFCKAGGCFTAGWLQSDL